MIGRRGGTSSSRFAPTVGTVKEGSDQDEASKTSSSRVGRIFPCSFDRKRASIVGVAVIVVVVLSVAVGITMFANSDMPSSTATTPPHPSEDGLLHLHKYTYVFVAYDRLGYRVAEKFYEQLEMSMEEQDHHTHPRGGRLKEQFIDPISNFNTETQCVDMNLEASTVTILESPELHCNNQKLRSLFMDHQDLTLEKWGVKLIHLVRNPFSMAVEHYQDVKSFDAPEELRTKNPCGTLTQISTNEDVIATNSTAPHLQPLTAILSENGIVTRSDFDNILAQCNNMYQTQPGLETASYHQHLEQLSLVDGVKLSVADDLHNIALMANDLIRFEHLHNMVEEEANTERKKIRYLDMMTLPLDQVLNNPANSMMEFLDFIFDTSLSANFKHKAAKEFERSQHAYGAGSINMDSSESEELIEFLKNDLVFGGPLSRVEYLLDSVLSGQEMSEEVEMTNR